MERCKHGLFISTCSNCNGFNENLVTQERKRKDESWEVLEVKKRYDVIKGTLKKHEEPWSEEDSKLLGDKLQKIQDLESNEYKKECYEIAILLKRTNRSVRWHHRQMFSNLGKRDLKQWDFQEEVVEV